MSTNSNGSPADMLDRLRAVLPLRWFPDATPLRDALLAGLASTAASLYATLAYVRAQTRLSTVSDSLLDTAVADFCGGRLWRRPMEGDATLRVRLLREILRGRATKAAMVSVLSDLTGRTPAIFEPANPPNTGGWTIACGYGIAGAWGSLSMPFQTLIVAYRPFAPGAPAWTGGAGPGAPAGPPIQGQVTDEEIYAAVATTMPIAMTAWTAISN